MSLFVTKIVCFFVATLLVHLFTPGHRAWPGLVRPASGKNQAHCCVSFVANGGKPSHVIGESNANSWRTGSDFLHESESESESYLTQFSEKPHLELLEGSRFFRGSCGHVGMIFSPEKDRDKRDRDGVIRQFVAGRATLWAAFGYIALLHCGRLSLISAW